MNTGAVKAAEQVVHAAMVNGRRTAAGIAVALESAQLLQSPKSAAELELANASAASMSEALEQARVELAELRKTVERQGRCWHDETQTSSRRLKRARTAERQRDDIAAERDKLRARVAELEAEQAESHPADEDPITYALTEKAEASAARLSALLAPSDGGAPC